MTKWLNEQAGRLDQRIVIEREVKSPDAQGGFTSVWSTFTTVWAGAKAMSGNERNMADQTENPRDYRFIVRRTCISEQITNKDRISWNGKIMNIKFIADNAGKEQFMMIEAKAGVAT